MFKRLYKTFYYENFTYVVNSSKETVIDRLDHLFMEKSRLLRSNLNGKFVDFPDTFYMTQKWWLTHIRNFDREPAILKGVLSKISDTQTRIDIAVRPNSVFLIFAVFFLPYGLFNLYRAVTTKDTNAVFGGLWLTFFVLPLLFMLARIASNRLRRAFEKHMSATPVDDHKLPLTSVLQ